MGATSAKGDASEPARRGPPGLEGPPIGTKATGRPLSGFDTCDALLNRRERPVAYVHQLQVYSNLAPGAALPQDLLFRSTQGERQQVPRAPSRRARHLRADEAELLVTRYLAAPNVRAVAREFQISRTTVARILTEHGVDASRRMTQDQVAVAVELYQQRLSSAAIGKRLGFDNHTILRVVRSRGVEVRPATGRMRR